MWVEMGWYMYGGGSSPPNTLIDCLDVGAHGPEWVLAV
jgi:hypothetical protein